MNGHEQAGELTSTGKPVEEAARGKSDAMTAFAAAIHLELAMLSMNNRKF